MNLSGRESHASYHAHVDETMGIHQAACVIHVMEEKAAILNAQIMENVSMEVVFVMQRKALKERYVKNPVVLGGRLIVMGTGFATLQQKIVCASQGGLESIAKKLTVQEHLTAIAGENVLLQQRVVYHLNVSAIPAGVDQPVSSSVLMEIFRVMANATVSPAIMAQLVINSVLVIVKYAQGRANVTVALEVGAGTTVSEKDAQDWKLTVLGMVYAYRLVLVHVIPDGLVSKDGAFVIMFSQGNGSGIFSCFKCGPNFCTRKCSVNMLTSLAKVNIEKCYTYFNSNWKALFSLVVSPPRTCLSDFITIDHFYL